MASHILKPFCDLEQGDSALQADHKHAQPGALMSYEKAGSSQLPAKRIFLLLARWEALSGTHCASEVSLASNALAPFFFMDIIKQCFFYTAWHL